MGGVLLLLSLWAAALVSAGYPAYERANSLFVAKKFPECLAAVEEALRLDSKLVPALTLKAKLALAMNRFDVARESLDRALASDPRSAYAQFLYGLQFYLSNDLQAALPHFQKARELNPGDARAALYLGLTTESLGQTEEALSLYRDAVRLEQSTAAGPEAETLLPGARLLLLLGRLDDCESWIRLALKASPKLRDAHFEYARLLLKKGEPGHSAAEAETALSLSEGTTTDTQIHYLLIRAWQQDGMPDRAERHAEALRAMETPARP
jgi:anaphase-promoting complex subunit 3